MRKLTFVLFQDGINKSSKVSNCLLEKNKGGDSSSSHAQESKRKEMWVIDKKSKTKNETWFVNKECASKNSDTTPSDEVIEIIDLDDDDDNDEDDDDDSGNDTETESLGSAEFKPSVTVLGKKN